MKLLVGEAYVLASNISMWKEYPVGCPTSGFSYETFRQGDVVTLVDVGKHRNTDLAYVVDSRGMIYVTSVDYLARQVKR